MVASRLLYGHSFDEILQPAEPNGASYRNTVLVPPWSSRADLAWDRVGSGWAVSRSLLRMSVPGHVLGTN